MSWEGGHRRSVREVEVWNVVDAMLMHDILKRKLKDFKKNQG